MRLPAFLLSHAEPIVAEFEAFARTLQPSATGMTQSALRDHAQQMLAAIAADLLRPQTPEQQIAKSHGLAPASFDAPQTAAETHAILRAKSGFDVRQLAAEYRALRASVLRLWTAACAPEPPNLEDVIRFNEAIDQALAESISFFTAQVERSRNLLLAMLGHDMRAPLTAIVMSATTLSESQRDPQVSAGCAIQLRSAAAIKALLGEMMDFNRTTLGLSIQVEPADIDLADTLAQEIDLQRAGYPDRLLEYRSSGPCHGHWDPQRMQQLLRNLVTNAITHGTPGTGVRVALECTGTGACLEVINDGSPIPADQLDQMFDPLRRGSDVGATRERVAGLGLGLYIVREIARAHRGDVEGHCAEGKIRFVVHLPQG